MLSKSKHNPNAREAQNYSIVEDLAQAPCAMSALEVLQSFTTQRKELLSFISAINLNDTGLITFDLEQLTSRLPSHIAFQINVLLHGMNILRTIIDEGASTCVMSLGC